MRTNVLRNKLTLESAITALLFLILIAALTAIPVGMRRSLAAGETRTPSRQDASRLPSPIAGATRDVGVSHRTRTGKLAAPFAPRSL